MSRALPERIRDWVAGYPHTCQTVPTGTTCVICGRYLITDKPNRDGFWRGEDGLVRRTS